MIEWLGCLLQKSRDNTNPGCGCLALSILELCSKHQFKFDINMFYK